MKTKYIKTLALLLGAGILGGCGENAWNDHLDGFKEPPVYSTTETVNYTLTAKDYSTIAGLSANKAIASAAGESDALKAIGTNACFASQEEAQKYLPAFLADSSFPYFTLNNGSSIKVSYALASGYSEEADAINAACPLYKVTEEDYQGAWGSDEDFISGFAPVTPASANLPKILLAAYPDAAAGDYVVASYAEASQNPIFSAVEGGDDVATSIEESFDADKGTFTMEDITLPEGSSYVWKWGTYGGVGYMQASGYVNKQNLDSDSWLVSPAVKIDGDAVLSFQYIVNFFADVAAAEKELTLGVRVAGEKNWTSVEIPNKPAKLSYDWIESGDISLSAWSGKTVEIGFHYISTTAKAGTARVTDVKVLPATRATRAAVAEVPTEAKYAIYSFDGSKWSEPQNTIVIQPSDYTAMGLKYGNMQDDQPSTFIPVYLKTTLPYAQDEDQVTVVYRYYTGSTTVNRADIYNCTGAEWTRGNVMTDQFTRNDNVWKFNPSVIINLPAVKNDANSVLYYQACVDWVYENIDRPLGSTDIKSGVGYVTKYGNNEYYSGTSAYQCNVDLRASAAKSQYPAGYEDMTDDEIVELEKYRFCYEVFPAVLSELHPDARPLPGLDITYTVNFSAYTGSSTDAYKMVYKVVGNGEFEFVSCDWWESGTSSLAK
ncbi:MAG: choice-of-anchor J domain-containing protein [Muribaculaceae bacterium]|nr:choice-of-anchor J domain-containing protein [Muribaculaceae bacterium]